MKTKVGKMLLTDKYKGDTITVDTEERVHCPLCQRTIFVGTLGPGTAIEIKCTRCKEKFKVKKL